MTAVVHFSARHLKVKAKCISLEFPVTDTNALNLLQWVSILDCRSVLNGLRMWNGRIPGKNRVVDCLGGEDEKNCAFEMDTNGKIIGALGESQTKTTNKIFYVEEGSGEYN